MMTTGALGSPLKAKSSMVNPNGNGGGSAASSWTGEGVGLGGAASSAGGAVRDVVGDGTTVGVAVCAVVVAAGGLSAPVVAGSVAWQAVSASNSKMAPTMNMANAIKYTIFKTKWGYFGLAGTESGLLRTCLPLNDSEMAKTHLLNGLQTPRYN